MRERIQVGERREAFHPRMFGVVKVGEVTKVGSKYAHIDFGELLGGVVRVPLRDVLGLDKTPTTLV